MFAQTGDTSFKNPAPTDANVSSVFEEKQQPARCRDPLFAVLFYINLGVIIAIASIFGVSPFVDPDENAQDAGENGDTINFSPFIYTIGLCGGIGLVMSCLAVNVLMCIPGILIKVALIGNLVLTLGFAVIAVMYGSIAVAILCFIGFALCACYTFCIWSRIPFATVSSKLFNHPDLAFFNKILYRLNIFSSFLILLLLVVSFLYYCNVDSMIKWLL